MTTRSRWSIASIDANASPESVRPVCEHVFVRWDNLTIEADEDGARLPGLPRPGGVRRFDAPEALDTRFYEVRAKSALNRVPEGVAHAVPLDGQPVPGLQPCLRVLLRPPTHTYLDFDAGRDFEREIVVKVNAPEVRAGGAAAAVVEGRARRDGDEHRSVPVGRVALRADAAGSGRRCATRATRARSSRSRRCCCATSTLLQEIAQVRDGPARTCRSRRWTRRPGGRPSRTRRTRGRGSRRWPSSTAPGSRPAS